MLNKKETKQLASLLKKIDKPHQGLPQPVFDALLEVVPFVACELAVVNEKDEFLLTWREDELYQGWHFPGRLMRFRESFKKCLDKVAQNELGIRINNYDFLSVKDCSQGRRGHIVSLVFRCRTAKAPKQGKYFKKMPKNIIADHIEFWKKLQKF